MTPLTRKAESMRLVLKVFAVVELVLLIVHPGAQALSRDEFPRDFVFGASTSAYQVLLSPSLSVFHTLHCPSFVILCWICDWRDVKDWRCSKWRWQEAKHMGHLLSCWKWYYPLLTTLIFTLCFISFHILNLFFKFYCYYLFHEISCKDFFQRICMLVMEMLHVIIITNIRLVTLECKDIYT